MSITRLPNGQRLGRALRDVHHHSGQRPARICEGATQCQRFLGAGNIASFFHTDNGGGFTVELRVKTMNLLIISGNQGLLPISFELFAEIADIVLLHGGGIEL